MRLCIVFCTIVILSISACGKKQLSERDRNLQDRQRSVDLKKNEMEQLRGDYWGYLEKDNDFTQRIKLHLDVKEVPDSENGQQDPILTPKYIGHLRFQFGEDGSDEYIDCPITKGEFNKQESSLFLVVNNEQFEDMVIKLKYSEGKLAGDWSASSVGANGTINISK